ncbi:TPR-like protein [Calocera viscosa TUFC12733]|uniref:TPR-like protein n=1 Tax=Calocera viscosa (strain TUFC12733) TaxID=1330018 RepID=A0A167R9F4_CALVF|nr:TPR-like protein [Calocera viscosa TUFC12733]
MSGPFPQPPSPADLEKALQAFDRTPLFMQSLPSSSAGEGEEDDQESVALEALKSLAHEGTADGAALNFKELGNEYFRGKRWREAVGFYTQGIDAKPEDMKLRESLLLNRAACNLELQNYRKVLADTSLVLLSSPTASKAYYRAGLALTRLEKWHEALDVLGRAAALQPGDAGVARALEEARRGKEEAQRKVHEKREAGEMRRAVEVALQARAITLVKTQSPPPQEAFPFFDPSYLPPNGATFTPPPPTTPLVMPVLLLYPLVAQTDLLTAFPESSTFQEQLTPVLADPPPWDEQGAYKLGTVGVYVVTVRGRVLKLAMGRRLLDVWPAAAGKEGLGDGVVCRDGWVEVYLLPRGEEERKWVDEMKAKLKK